MIAGVVVVEIVATIHAAEVVTVTAVGRAQKAKQNGL